MTSAHPRSAFVTLAAAVAVATAVTAVSASPAAATVGQPGTVDTTFNTPFLSGGVGSIAVQSDGKLIIVGNFENLGPNHIGYVSRLNSDGSLDPSFVPPIFGFNGVPRTAAVLPSGDIVVAGGFTDYRVGVGPLQIANKILKLSSTGAVKPFPAPSFGPFGIGEINTLAIDPINYYPSPPRIMVGGTFASVGGDGSYRAFASLIEGGSLDATPKIGFTGGSDSVRAIVTRPSGYLVGGQFQSPYGGIDHGITRTILDGSHDNTFVPPNIDGIVESIDVASNGKMLVTGAFSDVSVKGLKDVTSSPVTPYAGNPVNLTNYSPAVIKDDKFRMWDSLLGRYNESEDGIAWTWPAGKESVVNQGNTGDWPTGNQCGDPDVLKWDGQYW
ncbi:MAG: delta-60 repeat domain-containing protein, partial [Actinomycetes bacterium]